jgi:hypothetical protein
MQEAGAALLFILFFIVVLFVLWCHISRSWKIVKQWAHDNDMELIEVQRRFLRRGPYWCTGNCQDVFRVTVRDGSGQERSGYVRVGGWLLGLLSDQVDVEWD